MSKYTYLMNLKCIKEIKKLIDIPINYILHFLLLKYLNKLMTIQEYV